jgi:hypothetical protein
MAVPENETELPFYIIITTTSYHMVSFAWYFTS